MEQPLPEEAQKPPREPVFNLPSVLVWLIGLLWAIHLVRAFVLDESQDFWLIFHAAFFPVRYSIAMTGQGPAWFTSPLTYSLLHGGWTHLIVNTIWLAAFGAIVARRIGTVRTLVFWVVSAVLSAAVFAAFNWGAPTPVIGASGVVSAFMGAAARFAFPRGGRFDREKAHFQPRLGIVEALSSRTVLSYVGIWFVINAVAAFGFTGGVEAGAGVAWEAHLGGFLFGFLCFDLMDRRNWR